MMRLGLDVATGKRNWIRVSSIGWLQNKKCFLEESRQLMHLPPRQSTAEAGLMVPFQLAALKTIGDEDKYLSRVSLRMPSFGINVTTSQTEIPKKMANIDGNLGVFSHVTASSELSLDGWDGIALEYFIDWPLQLFFTQEVLSKYRKVFQYLIRLKRTQMELEKTWAAVMQQDHTYFANRHKNQNSSLPQQRRLRYRPMWRVREHMTFLIRNLQFTFRLMSSSLNGMSCKPMYRVPMILLN